MNKKKKIKIPETFFSLSLSIDILLDFVFMNEKREIPTGLQWAK